MFVEKSVLKLGGRASPVVRSRGGHVRPRNIVRDAARMPNTQISCQKQCIYCPWQTLTAYCHNSNDKIMILHTWQVCCPGLQNRHVYSFRMNE